MSKNAFVIYQIMTPNIGFVKNTDDFLKENISVHTDETKMLKYIESHNFNIMDNATAGLQNNPVFETQSDDETLYISYEILELF